MRAFHPFIAGVTSLALAASGPPALAGGFLNATQSASAAAVANAGVTALAEDAATVFLQPGRLNPA